MRSIKEEKKLNWDWYKKRMSESSENNAKIFTRNAPKKCGKYVKLLSGYYGFCVGMTLGWDDYYWLVINQDRKIEYHSAVCDLEYLDLNEFPVELNILDYMLEHDEESIINKINDSLNGVSDVLITDIYLKNRRITQVGEGDALLTR